MGWPSTDIWSTILFAQRAHVAVTATMWVGFITAILYVSLALAARFVETKLDPREPPLVNPGIPLIGHAIGIARYGPKYFQSTSTKTNSPIYTLKIFSGTIYIITAPSVVNIVSKNTKTISFNPFIAEVAIRITHCSPKARKIIERDMERSDSYVTEIHNHIIAAMAPGSELQRLTASTVRCAWSGFLAPVENKETPTISLYSFLREMLTISSTNAIYGSKNPFSADLKVQQAYWDYIGSINSLIINVQQQLIARKGHKAREYLATTFEKYLTDCDKSSVLTKGRRDIAKKHGMNDADVARTEVGNMIGILVNTVPMLFYLIVHIYSDPELLADIRQEIDENVIHAEGREKPQFVIPAVQNSCPLLSSTFHETLRCYSEGATVRLVCEDTVLDGRVLLKKGGIVQLPSSVIHRDPATWGDASFHARRFLKSDTEDKASNIRSSTAAGAYRPWGGGSTLCPGRHLATNEVMTIAALVVWRFDMRPANRSDWSIPAPKQVSVVEAVFRPSCDIDVEVRRRESEHSAAGFDMVFD